MSAYRYDGFVINAVGEAIPGALVYVCNQPATTNVIPPSPLASLFTDSTGATPLTNPVVTDGNGNFAFYAATGTYTLVYFDPYNRIPTQIYPDQAVLTPGGGTVTSIALTAPAELTITGSPITTTGTIALAWANENANLIFAGPASGPAGTPGFRSLVTADLPAGVGSVTSVGLSVVASSLLTGSISGSPVTSAGTLGLTIGFANQPANTGFFGPTAGGSGPITARKMVPADQPGGTTVSSSASMTFDASVSNSFRVAMSSNVTSTTITNPTPRQVVTFIIAENSTGGYTFVYPSNVRGASAIQADANGVNIQSFIYDEVTSMWRATGPGSWNAS